MIARRLQSPGPGALRADAPLRAASAVWRALARRLKPLGPSDPQSPDGSAALLKAAKALLREGRCDEAIERLEAAVALDPKDLDLQKRLARLQHDQGRILAEETAWKAALDAAPDFVEAHQSLAKIFIAQERLVEAAPHLLALALSRPQDADAWNRLANCCADVGDPTGEAAALRRVAKLAPHDLGVRSRLCELALAAGDLDEAAQAFRAVAEARPNSLAAWEALAVCLGRSGDVKGEADAWERVLALLVGASGARTGFAIRAARRLTQLGDERAASAWRWILLCDPHRTEARTQLEEIRRYGLGGETSPPPAPSAPAQARGARPRLLILGNCQAFGLGRQLRAMCPSVEVRTVGLAELDAPEDAAAVAARWDRFDYAVTQPDSAPDDGPMGRRWLKEHVGQLAYFPRINFRGFHPDVLRAGTHPLGPYPVQGFHSAIIMAAHALGVPERLVPDLFNAYVHGVLGYFDEYPKAELYHVNDARWFGVALGPFITQWRPHGAFVHVPNHPILAVFQSLAASIARTLGLEIENEAGDFHDELEGFGVWPVYPEIAARLGFKGGLRFRLGHDMAPIELDEFVARSYRAYAAVDPELTRQGVQSTVDILRREGV